MYLVCQFSILNPQNLDTTATLASLVPDRYVYQYLELNHDTSKRFHCNLNICLRVGLFGAPTFSELLETACLLQYSSTVGSALYMEYSRSWCLVLCLLYICYFPSEAIPSVVPRDAYRCAFQEVLLVVPSSLDGVNGAAAILELNANLFGCSCTEFEDLSRSRDKTAGAGKLGVT